MILSPKVSVIMAAYNAEKFISYSIQSILNQTFTDFELLVIGDCCTDNTQQIVENFEDSRIHWYNLPQNIGSQGIPNNEGLSRAKGEYMAYLSHDDLWFLWHLEKLLAHLQAKDYGGRLCSVRPKKSLFGFEMGCIEQSPSGPPVRLCAVVRRTDVAQQGRSRPPLNAIWP